MRSVTEHAFFLPYDMPATNTEGYSRTVVTYSPVGNQIVHAAYWYGTNYLANCAAGYASLTNGYDEAGNLIYVAFYDSDGKLTRTESGYLIRKMKYDSEHHEIERINVDGSEKLQNDATGRAKYLTHYTATGQNLGMTAFDFAGNPRLPMCRFCSAFPEKNIRTGDVILACDQWRYVKESERPLMSMVTNGVKMTGIVVARPTGDQRVATLVRCPGTVVMNASLLRERGFQIQQEAAILALFAKVAPEPSSDHLSDGRTK
jgi:hypothetical protein